MQAMILAKILTLGNIAYFIVSTVIAAAILNKSKLPNIPHMLWAIPASWVGLIVVFWLFGALFKLIVGAAIIVGIIAECKFFSGKT